MQKTSESRVDETSQSTARATAGQDVGELPAGKAGGESHSPLPWHGFVKGLSGFVLEQDGRNVLYDADEVRLRGNVDFIVRAANSFDALVAALKDTLDYWDSTGFSDCAEGCNCIVESVRAALAKAEARSQD